MSAPSPTGDLLRIGPGYFRGHGLGNDYLVVEVLREAAGRAAGEAGEEAARVAGAEAGAPPPPPRHPSRPAPGQGWPLTPEAVRRLCARGKGVGSDGVVVLLDDDPPGGAPFPLRMFNPDGSEFERSGNGLRVLGAALHARGLVGSEPFQVRSGGSVIRMQVHGVAPGGVRDLSVEMGRAQAGREAAAAVAWTGEGAYGGFALTLPGVGVIRMVPAWVGNPHAVVFLDAENPALLGEEEPGSVELDGPLLHRVGPFLATHPAFGRGTNVQLARVRGRDLEIGIWERGVGRTPASGTSSCAAAVAAVATGRRTPGVVRVRMPGGELQVTVTPELDVLLRGPVQEVASGVLAPGFVESLGGEAVG
jgi:diaminopimelate epimerase